MRERETLSRDAKTYNRRTTVAAYAGIRGLRDSRQQRSIQPQSIPLLPHLSHPTHHICQNGRSPRKEVPRTCWYVQLPSLAALTLNSLPIADSLAIARPMAPFYIAGS
jgi:hypothetical protein